MKPRNKFDHHCLELSYKLDAKPISQTHINWAKKAIYWHYYTTHYNNKICLECNHVFKAEPRKDKTITCPSCYKKLHLTYHLNLNGFFSVHQTIDNCQVERIFAIDKYMSKANPSKFYVSEVIRRFINLKGQFRVLTKTNSGIFGGISFHYHSDFEIKRSNTNATNLNCTNGATFPKRKFLPELIRNGYNWKSYDPKNRTEAMRMVLSDNFYEWLLKTNKTFAAYYFSNSRGRSELPKLKSQLKMLFKSGIQIKSIGDYLDYIQLLKYFGKDINNPKYICPKDLHAEHQKLVRKHAAIKAKEDAAAKIIHHQILTKEYREAKAKYLDISIKSGDFTFVVPQTIDDFERAGTELEHCIYSNKYYRRQTVLLFAYKGDKLTETAEIDPKEKKILQCRGYDNKPTQDHNTIVNIIQQNLNLFTTKRANA